MTTFSNFVVYSNLIISFSALCLYELYRLKLNDQFDVQRALFVFSSTFMAYHFVRYIPFKKKHLSGKNLKDYYDKFDTFNKVSIITASVLILSSLHKMLNHLIILILGVLIVLSYERFFFKKYNLRKIPYLKPIIISFTWAIICTGLQTRTDSFYFVDCFLFIFFLCLPFDMKDQEEDRKEKLKTFSMHFSREKFTKLLITLNTLYALISFAVFREVFMMFYIFLYAFFLLFYTQKKINFYIFLDGLIILRLIIYFFQN